LRNRSEAYAREFNGENDALTPESTLSWEEKLRTVRHSVVQPPEILLDFNLLLGNRIDNWNWTYRVPPFSLAGRNLFTE